MPDRLTVGVDKVEPIRLRLRGNHVLAGLRNLVQCGMDRIVVGPQSSFVGQQGLPTWLTEVRSTKVKVGIATDGSENTVWASGEQVEGGLRDGVFSDDDDDLERDDYDDDAEV